MNGWREVTGELSHAAAGMSGTSGAAALRQVRSLADCAPSGRMFSAIATLTDMSRRAETTLEAGQRALAAGDVQQASEKFARALGQMDNLSAAAARSVEQHELPSFLKNSI